jgi:hypothetical protein
VRDYSQQTFEHSAFLRFLWNKRTVVTWNMNTPPRYTRESIEQRAEQLLARIDPSLLTRPQRTPMEEIVHRLAPFVPVIHDEPLGLVGQKRILGKFVFSPPVIFIDPGLKSVRLDIFSH